MKKQLFIFIGLSIAIFSCAINNEKAPAVSDSVSTASVVATPLDTNSVQELVIKDDSVKK